MLFRSPEKSDYVISFNRRDSIELAGPIGDELELNKQEEEKKALEREFFELLGGAAGGGGVAEEMVRGEPFSPLKNPDLVSAIPPVLVPGTPRSTSLGDLEEAEIERITLEKLKKRYVKKSTLITPFFNSSLC